MLCLGMLALVAVRGGVSAVYVALDPYGLGNAIAQTEVEYLSVIFLELTLVVSLGGVSLVHVGEVAGVAKLRFDALAFTDDDIVVNSVVTAVCGYCACYLCAVGEMIGSHARHFLSSPYSSDEDVMYECRALRLVIHAEVREENIVVNRARAVSYLNVNVTVV